MTDDPPPRKLPVTGDKPLESRVTAIEAQISSLADDVRTTNRALERHAERTYAAIEQLADRVAQSAQGFNEKFLQSRVVPWGALAAWAAIILSLVAVATSGHVRDQDRLERAVLEHAVKFEDFLKEQPVEAFERGRRHQRIDDLDVQHRLFQVELREIRTSLAGLLLAQASGSGDSRRSDEARLTGIVDRLLHLERAGVSPSQTVE